MADSPTIAASLKAMVAFLTRGNESDMICAFPILTTGRGGEPALLFVKTTGRCRPLADLGATSRLPDPVRQPRD